MKTLRATTWTAVCACLALQSAANAGGSHTSRTYFGWPGQGPYQTAPKYRNPWTAKIFGIPFCVTDEDRYERFQKKYQIEQARHQVRLDRLNWDAYEEHMRPTNSLAGFVGKCDCRDGCQNGKCHDGGKCHKGGDCGKSGLLVSKSHGCHGGCKGGCGHGKRDGRGGYGVGEGGIAAPIPGYPAMNREDATRYLEGFQYYPPYQLIRSPRDFFMWDVRYGIGR
jgi:hypothetical protein